MIMGSELRKKSSIFIEHAKICSIFVLLTVSLLYQGNFGFLNHLTIKWQLWHSQNSTEHLFMTFFTMFVILEVSNFVIGTFMLINGPCNTLRGLKIVFLCLLVFKVYFRSTPYFSLNHLSPFCEHIKNPYPVLIICS